MQHELQLHRLEAGPDPDAGELDARALVAGGQPRVELAQLGSAQEPAHGDVAVVRFGRRRRWRGCETDRRSRASRSNASSCWAVGTRAKTISLSAPIPVG